MQFIRKPKMKSDRSGINILLGLSVLGLAITPIFMGLALYTTFIPIFSGGAWEMIVNKASPYYHPLFAPLIVFEAASNVLFIIFALYLLLLYGREKKAFPKLAAAFYIASFTVVVADYLFGEMVPFIANTPDDLETIKSMIKSTVAVVILVPYLLKSKRVKEKFVK